MPKSFSDKIWELYPFGRRRADGSLPDCLPWDPSKRLVRVYVEGYEDVAFWRGIFDHFSNPHCVFEISVPNRPDMAKGKKVVMSMLPQSGPALLLCVDSDFDYLFQEANEQSHLVSDSPFLFHTYAYATENYVCYAPSLHNVCVRATKNDMRIFDFEYFMAEYSKAIHPLFLWYAYSARESSQSRFTLADFRNSVKLNYLELERNGENTLAWLRRQCARRLATLVQKNPGVSERVGEFGRRLEPLGLSPETTYLFMHGHTLMDNVVLVVLGEVCEKLRSLSLARITASAKKGVALANEMSNYHNAQRNVREVLLDNENYTDCFLYRKLRRDIERYLEQSLERC